MAGGGIRADMAKELGHSVLVLCRTSNFSASWTLDWGVFPTGNTCMLHQMKGGFIMISSPAQEANNNYVIPTSRLQLITAAKAHD